MRFLLISTLTLLILISTPSLASPPSAFPSYHFRPPLHWINDPCAPFYDPSTQLCKSLLPSLPNPPIRPTHPTHTGSR